MAILTLVDFANAKRDISDIGKSVNEDAIVQPRWGGAYDSLPRISRLWLERFDLLAGNAESTIQDWQDAINLITVEGGIPALAVSDASGINQQEFNNKTITTVESIADLIAIQNPKDGQVVNVVSYYKATNYSLLNPYSGGGDFIYVASRANENDGGAIFNGWFRLNIDRVKPEWWGAIADSFFDCTSAIQRAIDFSNKHTALKPSWVGGGHLPIEFSHGVYRVTNKLNLRSFTGLKIHGAGMHSTAIMLDATNKTLFDFDVYLDINIADMALLSGRNTESGFVPDTNLTNICFKYTSQTGGSFFVQDRLLILGFDEVYNSTTSTVNGDNHIHNQCVYYSFNKLWNNTCTQAVIWTFNEAKAYYGKDCFVNSANNLVVNGGDWINYGTFIASKLVGTGSESTFNYLRFESYQNIDPDSNPMLLDIEGDRYLTFNNCTNSGGGSLEGKVTAKITGLFNIILNNCWFDGIWDINVASSLDGITSTIDAQNCKNTPIFNQILREGAGYRPINIILSKHHVTQSVIVDRNYKGAISTANQSIRSGEMSDYFYIEDFISASPSSKAISIYTIDPYILGISSIDVSMWTNGVEVITFDFYTSSSKTIKIGSLDMSVAQNKYQVKRLDASDFLNQHEITTLNNAFYVEISAPTAAGLCRANININLLQLN